MDYNQFRNIIREWVRARIQSDTVLSSMDLVTPNESSKHGDDEYWMRYSLQTSQDADLIGTGGPGQRVHRRYGRIFIECFGPKGVGEGQISQTTAKLETLFRNAMPAESPTNPNPQIYILEPSTFERPGVDKYCQVVSVPVQADTVS